LTSEQLESSRAERLRLNGTGTLTLDEARTWIEETGLCLFMPRRQFSTSIAPSFVEAVIGQQNATPDPKYVALAEELLVRLETENVAVRLNLLGQPGESPDFVVAAWVLPYVYALRGDRDWRRIPQLTGSRQVSPLAVQTYKVLEADDATIPSLKHTLGREVTEQAVLRAITELWQQLRIIPVIAAPGQTPKWQLLRTRYQKAIAEGASTSQVTAISVLASIFLQAVIAATMEDVEMFLSPLTARSKIREVIRGLVATRQVHTLSLGHAPHFYVAGTLPEFTQAPTVYASATMPASAYFFDSNDREGESFDRFAPAPAFPPMPAPAPVAPPAVAAPVAAKAPEVHAPRYPAVRKPVVSQKQSATRPHFSRPAAHSRDRKPAQNSSARTSRSSSSTRWSSNGTRSSNGQRHAAASSSNGNGKAHNHSGKGASSLHNGKTSAMGQHNGHGKPAGKNSSPLLRSGSSARKDVRSSARPAARSASNSRKPALTAGAKAGNSKRYGFTAPARQRATTKKRG
jgi:23S rRNA pseudouridine2605 synthase